MRHLSRMGDYVQHLKPEDIQHGIRHLMLLLKMVFYVFLQHSVLIQDML